MLSSAFLSSLLLVFLYSQFSATTVTAFVAAPSPSFFVRQHLASTSSPSKLAVSTIYSDFSEVSPRLPLSTPDTQELQDFAVPVGIETASLRSMDLPKHGPSAEQIQTTKALMSVEMMLGRGAMILAVILAATEVTTGRSLPEQLSSLFSWKRMTLLKRQIENIINAMKAQC